MARGDRVKVAVPLPPGHWAEAGGDATTAPVKESRICKLYLYSNLTLCRGGTAPPHIHTPCTPLYLHSRMFTLHTTACSHSTPLYLHSRRPESSRGLPPSARCLGCIFTLHATPCSHSTPQHLHTPLPQASEFTGVTTIGAVPWLLNYNVPLASASLRQGESGTLLGRVVEA